MAGGQLLNQSGRENSSTQEPPRQLRTGKFCSFAREQLPGASWGEGNSTQCPAPIPGSCCSQPLQTWLGMDKSCRILHSHHGAGHNPPHSLELQPSWDGREPPAAPRVFLGVNPSPPSTPPAMEIHCWKKLNCSAGERKGKPDTFPSSNTTLEENQLKSKEPLPRVPRPSLLQPGGFGAGAPAWDPPACSHGPSSGIPLFPGKPRLGI